MSSWGEGYMHREVPTPKTVLLHTTRFLGLGDVGLEVLAVVTGGHEMFPLSKKGGGGRQRFLPCLKGGGGRKDFGHAIFLFFSPPTLHVINDQSLIKN